MNNKDILAEARKKKKLLSFLYVHFFYELDISYIFYFILSYSILFFLTVLPITCSACVRVCVCVSNHY